MTPRERVKLLYREHRVCKCLNEGTAQAIQDAITAAVADAYENAAKIAEHVAMNAVVCDCCNRRINFDSRAVAAAIRAAREGAG